MNLAVLTKTRRAPVVGDIFVMRPPDGRFLFGRVIDTNANPLGVGSGILIYIYRVRAAAKTPVPELLRGEMLVPLAPARGLEPRTNGLTVRRSTN